MNVNRIRQEIKGLQTRRAELIAEREPAAAAYSNGLNSVISSNASATSLEPFKAAINTFDSLISEIESLIATKEGELERDIIIERRQTLVRESVKLAECAKTAGNKCAEAIPEFSTKGVIAAVDKFLANRKIIWECRTRFKQIVLTLIPSAFAAQLRSLPDVDKQLEDLFAELDALGDFSVLRANTVFSNHEDKMIDLQINTFTLPQSELPETWRKALSERETILFNQNCLKEAQTAENSPPTKKTPLKVIASVLNSLFIF